MNKIELIFNFFTSSHDRSKAACMLNMMFYFFLYLFVLLKSIDVPINPHDRLIAHKNVKWVLNQKIK